VDDARLPALRQNLSAAALDVQSPSCYSANPSLDPGHDPSLHK
jgi:hypothetical protein